MCTVLDFSFPCVAGPCQVPCLSNDLPLNIDLQATGRFSMRTCTIQLSTVASARLWIFSQVRFRQKFWCIVHAVSTHHYNYMYRLCVKTLSPNALRHCCLDSDARTGHPFPMPANHIAGHVEIRGTALVELRCSVRQCESRPLFQNLILGLAAR